VTTHGAHCACTVCERADALDDAIGKAIARAAEWDDLSDCD
jgi:hypothetical protein